MRRLLPFTLALLAVGGMTACSSGGGSTTGAAGGDTTSRPGTTERASGGPGTTGGGTGGGLTLTSPAFVDGGAIPPEYSCQGEGTSPQLDWTGVPPGTTSLALVVHDPDAPIAGGFTHWVVYAIPPATTGIPRGGTVGTAGRNSTNQTGWVPPCPPSGTHRYEFTLYALPAMPSFTQTPNKADIEAVATDALARATLTGTYAKS